MAEEADRFAHHSPYRHRVRAIILLDAGLLTSARTIVVVAHFRLARKMMAKNRRYSLVFFLIFSPLLTPWSSGYSDPGPFGVRGGRKRCTAPSISWEENPGGTRKGPQEKRRQAAQGGTQPARRNRNSQTTATGLRQGAASCGIADPNQVARATSLDCLPRTRTDFGFGSRGAPACSRPVTHTCLPRLLWTGRACRRQFAQGAYHGSVRSRCTARCFCLLYTSPSPRD